jgi:ribonuclease HI
VYVVHEWSREHNSKFEVNKFNLVHFTQKKDVSTHDPKKRVRKARPPLTLGGTTIQPSKSTKFLGVILDEELRWNEQAKYAVGRASKYALLFRRLTRQSTGLKQDFMGRLYTTVILPKMLYAADVWYTPLHRPPGNKKEAGSVGFTKQMAKVQRIALLAMSGTLRSTPTDFLEAHLNVPPIDLFLHEICHRAMMRVASLPETHPLHKVIRYCAKRNVKRSKGPLHTLTHLYRIEPDKIERITPVRKAPTYGRPFKTIISNTREESLALDENDDAQIKIYTDGSGYKDNAGAAAVLIKGNEPPRTLKYHLGSLKEHTTYEAEAVAVTLGLHLLQTTDLPKKTSLALDNQGVIQATASQKARKTQYILDRIHGKTKALSKDNVNMGYSLTIRWISGHSGAMGNEMVDEAAKEAAEGESSPLDDLPKYIQKRNGILPLSISALKQTHRATLRMRWIEKWEDSPRYKRLKEYTEDILLSNFRRITGKCSRAQLSLLLQLRSGHIQLNKHLHRIGKAERPKCMNCNAPSEGVEHFLLDCPTFEDERHDNMRTLKDRSFNTLFETRDGVKAVLGFVNNTQRLRSYFGDVSPVNLSETDDNDARLPVHDWLIEEEENELYFN